MDIRILVGLTAAGLLGSFSAAYGETENTGRPQPVDRLRQLAQSPIEAEEQETEEQETEDTEDESETLRIVVTAEKRPDNLQDIPISITAFTEDDIEDADLTSFEDIAGATPNFTVYTPGRNFLLYSVRGLSNFNFLSRDPVAFYIDDVPYDYTGFLDLDLTDLERVEVLRGPQATLYGRNAEAGVVNVVTRKPTNTPEYSLTTTIGNFNTPELRASASGPLIPDKLFYR